MKKNVSGRGISGLRVTGSGLIVLYCFLIFILSCSAPALADDASIVIVKVNGNPITLNEVEEEIDRVIPQSFFHRNLKPEKREKLRKEAIQRLINWELQFQESKAQGITVGSKEIKDRKKAIIKSFPSEKEFKKALRRSKLSIKELEARIEKDIIVEKIFKKEVEDKVVPSDEEIKAHYENNTQIYRELEKVRIRHIMISADWKSNKERDIGEALGIAEKEKKVTRTREEAMALAEELLKRIEKGEDFAALAYQFSDDPYRVKSGDLGYIHRGMFLPELEPLAFSMEIGEIMGPLETGQGVYIIKVEDRKSGKQFSFDEVRDRIKKELTEEKKAERIKEWLKSLREKAGIEYLQLQHKSPTPGP